MCSYLKLNKIREEVIAYGLFGGIETKETQENEYQIRIEDIDSTVRIPVTVNYQDKFCNYVPRLNNNSRFTHILGHLDDSLVAV